LVIADFATITFDCPQETIIMLKTIAIEFVPPTEERGIDHAIEDARKVRDLSAQFGIGDRIGHLMIPGMIEEDPDRPVAMKPRLDTLEVWNAAREELGNVKGLCTQVTAFMQEDELNKRTDSLIASGFEGLIFVGVPRTMSDGEGGGVAPMDALEKHQAKIQNRGVILIPTRAEEYGRFNFKCQKGATFGLTQLLYSDAIVGFLKDFAGRTDYRPEILLSFGYVPQAEERVNLINWLIQDPGNPVVAEEQKFVSQIAPLSLSEKKQKLLDLYKRVVDGVGGLGFPLSIHLEAPYGFVAPAFECFQSWLEYYDPTKS
jgi:hypothetical protein